MTELTIYSIKQSSLLVTKKRRKKKSLQFKIFSKIMYIYKVKFKCILEANG